MNVSDYFINQYIYLTDNIFGYFNNPEQVAREAIESVYFDYKQSSRYTEWCYPSTKDLDVALREHKGVKTYDASQHINLDDVITAIVIRKPVSNGPGYDRFSLRDVEIWNYNKGHRTATDGTVIDWAYPAFNNSIVLPVKYLKRLSS